MDKKDKKAFGFVIKNENIIDCQNIVGGFLVLLNIFVKVYVRKKAFYKPGYEIKNDKM